VTKRFLIVTADDFGIGPATTQGILDLAVLGRVTATVLLVNSPYAPLAVRAWRQAGKPVELGWHPCLTLDAPVLPAERVPSLVDRQGRFWRLGPFMRRLFLGRIRSDEIEAELRAQYGRFCDLVDRRPTVVNSHHHVQVFPHVGSCLRRLLERQLPYVRRIREPWSMIARVRGARAKRTFLSALGRRDARRQDQLGFPGNDWLAGITDPPWVADADFLVRWLHHLPGTVGELTCHPGHWDTTLVGRDCSMQDGQLQRRTREFELLREPSFPEACRRGGWTLVSPSALIADSVPSAA
jgi:predicted glycoside hydrolase/deacetylase ChbG (UPF0249 family)